MESEHKSTGVNGYFTEPFEKSLRDHFGHDEDLLLAIKEKIAETGPVYPVIESPQRYVDEVKVGDTITYFEYVVSRRSRESVTLLNIAPITSDEFLDVYSAQVKNLRANESPVTASISELQKAAHDHAKEKGFHDKERSIGEAIALIHSELSEALEADRKDRHFGHASIRAILSMSDEDFKTGFEGAVKDTFEDELADTVIRILDLAGQMQIDLASHISAKMRYNKTRSKMHGGKKY